MWLTEDQLAETLARHPNLAATKRIAKLIGQEGTPTRSGWEDDFPKFCADHGLPAPVMGLPFHGYVADAVFVAERVIVELDSWPFHKGKIPFESDRERDAETLARGFVTVRVTEERLEQRPQNRGPATARDPRAETSSSRPESRVDDLVDARTASLALWASRRAASSIRAATESMNCHWSTDRRTAPTWSSVYG